MNGLLTMPASSQISGWGASEQDIIVITVSPFVHLLWGDDLIKSVLCSALTLCSQFLCSFRYHFYTCACPRTQVCHYLISTAKTFLYCTLQISVSFLILYRSSCYLALPTHILHGKCICILRVICYFDSFFHSNLFDFLSSKIILIRVLSLPVPALFY